MEKRKICNVVQAHKRLLEAHRLWHQALENYFDPEGFRTNVNAAIQALRNVTFALQNEKSKIPNYGEWYPTWQEALKSDEIMHWLCDARTAIVHKKDLEMYSTATVMIRCYETIMKATVSIPLFLSGKNILQYLVDEGTIDGALRNTDAYAVIERRWIVNEFPQHDVLYLLSYGIGKLFQMVDEAHTEAGTDINNCSVVDSLHPIELNGETIPVCTEFVQKPMQEIVGLKDYLTRHFSYRKLLPDADREKKALKRYRRATQECPISGTRDPFEFGEQLFQHAKRILQKDGNHINVVYMQTPDGNWKMLSPLFEDQLSKHIFWNNLAVTVKKENIVSIIFIGECWLGSFEILKETGLRAAEQADRKEALAVDVFTSAMQGKAYRALFHKNRLGKVIFDGDQIDDCVDMTVGYIKPIADVWNTN